MAASGTEALRILSELGNIYAMISDLDMPGMNGIELLTRVRDRQRYAKLILMSARFSDPNFDRNAPEYLIAGELLKKPIRLTDLRDTL